MVHKMWVFYQTYLNTCIYQLIEIKAITSIIGKIIVCDQLNLDARFCNFLNLLEKSIIGKP